MAACSFVSSRISICAVSFAASLMISAAARSETTDPPNAFYNQSLSAVLDSMGELASAVFALALDPPAVGGTSLHRIDRLQMLDRQFPNGLPLVEDGKLRAKLVLLTYKDAYPPGL